jgi:hypothetical protein
MKQDKRTNGKLDFGSIQKEVEKVRKRIEREHGLEVGDSLPHRSPATKMCVLSAITNKVDPVKVLAGVIEMFKAGDRSSDVLAGIKKTPGIKRDLRPK